MKRSILLFIGSIGLLHADWTSNIARSGKMTVVYMVAGLIAVATFVYFIKLFKDLKK